tara:strand:+ start:427 stop:855 length:429 start_codon:yes stop_codon:yes gene_type:complete
MWYLWLKAFHIVFVVTWFAGLFYLPRLFVYHSTTFDQIGNDRFKIMERKLYRAIMTPSMILTIGLGVILLSMHWSAYSLSPWMWIKLFLVTILVIYHLYCGRLIKDFAKSENAHTETFYRWFNEIPAIILIAIVILVVVKPI